MKIIKHEKSAFYKYDKFEFFCKFYSRFHCYLPLVYYAYRNCVYIKNFTNEIFNVGDNVNLLDPKDFNIISTNKVVEISKSRKHEVIIDKEVKLRNVLIVPECFNTSLLNEKECFNTAPLSGKNYSLLNKVDANYELERKQIHDCDHCEHFEEFCLLEFITEREPYCAVFSVFLSNYIYEKFNTVYNIKNTKHVTFNGRKFIFYHSGEIDCNNVYIYNCDFKKKNIFEPKSRTRLTIIENARNIKLTNKTIF